MKPKPWQLAALATGIHLALIAYNRSKGSKGKGKGKGKILTPPLRSLSLLAEPAARAEAAYNAFTASLPGEQWPTWGEFISTKPYRRYLTPLLNATLAAIKPTTNNNGLI